MGNSSVLPLGEAIRPRMPASWLTCAALPRAPESVIMRMGLNLSRPGRIRLRRLAVVAFQISTTFEYRSSSESIPMRYRPLISAT